MLPGVAAAQQAPHVHDEPGNSKPAASPKGTSEQRKPKTFDAVQFRLLSTLTELIIPKTDTPGAVEAGVPYLIDENAARSARLKTGLVNGLAALDAAVRAKYNKSFSDLSTDEQVAVLTPMSQEPTSDSGRFFKLIKDITIDAYYSTPEGLVKELGYTGRTYLPKFDGCTHPEHKG